MKPKKAKYRPSVPSKIKERIYDECGEKCANPGCTSRLLHMHHIKEWHIYRTHDAKHMICLCPTCHAYAHSKVLTITSNLLVQWKKARSTREYSATVHADACEGHNTKLLLGSILIAPENIDNSLVVFRMSANCYLQFEIRDNNITLLDACIPDKNGDAIFRVCSGHVRCEQRSHVQFCHRPGKCVVKAHSDLIPDGIWAIKSYIHHFGPSLIDDEWVTLFEAETVSPGIIRISGFWWNALDAAVVTKDDLCTLNRDRRACISFRGCDDRGLPSADMENLPIFYSRAMVGSSLFASLYYAIAGPRQLYDKNNTLIEEMGVNKESDNALVANIGPGHYQILG